MDACRQLPFLRNAAKMRYFDIYMRWLFPLAFVPYLLSHLGQVNYGADWRELIQDHACVKDSVG